MFFFFGDRKPQKKVRDRVIWNNVMMNTITIIGEKYVSFILKGSSFFFIDECFTF